MRSGCGRRDRGHAYHNVYGADGNCGPKTTVAGRLAWLPTRFTAVERTKARHAAVLTHKASRDATAFVGLLYSRAVRFDRIRCFSAAERLKEAVGRRRRGVHFAASRRHRSHAAGGRSGQLARTAFGQLCGTPFAAKPAVGPGAVIELPLTGFSQAQRIGYGWALGGVKGNGSAGYVSITELRAYGEELFNIFTFPRKRKEMNHDVVVATSKSVGAAVVLPHLKRGGSTTAAPTCRSTI